MACATGRGLVMSNRRFICGLCVRGDHELCRRVVWLPSGVRTCWCDQHEPGRTLRDFLGMDNRFMLWIEGMS